MVSSVVGKDVYHYERGKPREDKKASICNYGKHIKSEIKMECGEMMKIYEN